jgi:hypothetical protein
MNHRPVSVLRIMPAKIDPKVEGGIAAKDAVQEENVQRPTSNVRRRSWKRRGQNMIAGRGIAFEAEKAIASQGNAAITTAKVDIIIIDRARRLRRNHFRRLR